MSTPILVIGDGYLGTRIARHFGDRAEITIADMTDLAVIGPVIAEKSPQVIINAGAFTLTNDAEKPENQALAYDVNVKGPANLAYLARRQGAYLVHLSTGMVFDGYGSDGKGFRETDTPTPTSYYTWTKAWADAELAPFADADGILIARLHLPLSQFGHPRNLLNKLQKFDKVADIQGSLTVVEDLLVALEQLIEQRATGIYHVVNPETISLYEISQVMQKHGLIPAEKAIQKLSKEEFDAMVAASGGAYQPSSSLNTDKLQAAGITLRPIAEAVEQCVREFVASPE